MQYTNGSGDLYMCLLEGATENARPDNDGPQKLRVYDIDGSDIDRQNRTTQNGIHVT